MRPPRCGHWKAVEITEGAVDLYIEERLKAKDRPATVNRTMQLLGQAIPLELTRFGGG